MYKLTGSSHFQRPPSGRDANLTSPVREAIGRAEHHIAAREFGRAQECLADAWRLDPGNPYIPAIVERIEILQSVAREESSKKSSAHHALRYLATTVGAKFPDGVRSDSEVSGDQDLRVRRLMTVAISLVERGSIEPAFQALKKGYLLDPNHPEVRTCADRIVPLWEAHSGRAAAGEMVPQNRTGDIPGAAAIEAQRIAARKPAFSPTAIGQERRPDPPQDRLSNLLEQRERQRRAREQAMWRAASIPPRLTGAPGSPSQTSAREESSRRTKSSILPLWLRWKSPR
jgi:hypothetical protein